MLKLSEYEGETDGCTEEMAKEKIPTVGGLSLRNIDGLPTLKVYPMTSKKRGIVMIISITEFTCTEGFRRGGDYEADSIVNVFRAMDFFVCLHKNLNRNDFVTLMENVLADKSIDEYDCFVLFLLSHGSDLGRRGNIYLADRQPVGIDWLLSRFSSTHCDYLLHKPKIIFNPCCR